ncbi:MAG: hypothetical protein IAI49_07510 [Candidatus Eremiobacteraeota bacterium]|nr:hypothetical protein [Candidatus Eremiobacteraeota bacterium]
MCVRLLEARMPVAIAFLVSIAFAPHLARAGGSQAEVDAIARAAGNRRADAIALGTVLFAKVRRAQVVKVRIDGAMSHEVAGLVISGVKFHGKVSRSDFTSEVIDLVRTAFAASRVDEVDCWATVPLPAGARAIVSGDMAQPTSRTVFAVTVRRMELGNFAERIRRGTGVYWNPRFSAELGAAAVPGASRSGAQT